MDEPLETSELLAFVKIVDARSVTRAALELALPRATVSRRLARLEERLGVRLLRRTTRNIALTDVGEAFYGNARLALDAVHQAEDSVRRTDSVVRGPLRVSLPPIVDEGLNSMICDFKKLHPEVDLQLHFSTHYVDLRNGGFHLALRASSELEPGLVARTLMRIPVMAVASPEYLRQKGTPKSARDLRQHQCLLGFVRGEMPEAHWPLVRGGKLHITGSLVSNSLPLLTSAVIAGLGIAVLPREVVAEALDSGALVHVLSGIVGTEARLSIVYAEREFVPPQVRAFIDALVGWAPTRLASGHCGVTPSEKEGTSPRTSRVRALPRSSESQKKRRG